MYMSMREARSPTDLVSFIPFNDSAQSVFTERPVHDKQNLLASMMRHHPNGGTTFRNGDELLLRKVLLTQSPVYLKPSGELYSCPSAVPVEISKYSY